MSHFRRLASAALALALRRISATAGGRFLISAALRARMPRHWAVARRQYGGERGSFSTAMKTAFASRGREARGVASSSSFGRTSEVTTTSGDAQHVSWLEEGAGRDVRRQSYRGGGVVKAEDDRHIELERAGEPAGAGGTFVAAAPWGCGGEPAMLVWLLAMSQLLWWADRARDFLARRRARLRSLAASMAGCGGRDD